MRIRDISVSVNVSDRKVDLSVVMTADFSSETDERRESPERVCSVDHNDSASLFAHRH